MVIGTLQDGIVNDSDGNEIMPGLLDEFASWWDNRKRVGAANMRGLLADPAATLGLLGTQVGQDMTQYARDQTYNAGAMRSVMPEVQQQAADQMAGGLLGVTAYHGSPHIFDKFDMSKIGTGEGAQAYGHGLYFAENPAVALDYANKLSEPINRVKADAYTIAGDRQWSIKAFGPNGEFRPRVTGYLNDDEIAKHYGKDIADMILNTKYGGDFKNLKIDPPNLYKVDIPDAAVGKMLDWDKPLNQQPAAVRDVVGKIQAEYRKNPALDSPYIAPDATGEQIYKELATMSFRKFGAGADHNAYAADQMRQLGIPGIKYKDAGSRGAEGGTHNYVLFDDALANIIGRE